MPQGKEIGAFQLKSTSMRIVDLDGDSRTLEINAEGEVSGQLAGAVMLTMTVVGTTDRASYTDKSVGFLESGTLQGEGQGVLWLDAPGVWETRGVVTLSDGQSVIAEGRVKLADRTWTGNLYELE